MLAKLSSSMMCANFRNLEKDVRILEEIGVEYLHMDIMDGHFVPNFTMGPDMLNSIRDMSKLPFDIHLMVEKPENFIDIFNLQEGDLVSVHQESTVHLQRVLQKISDKGARPAVAINPATPLIMIKHVLTDIDMVLIMTVNPGFAGQKLVPSTLEKIREIYDLREKYNLKFAIEADGNISFENARKMRLAGTDIFVVGSSSLFNGKSTIKEASIKLREAINL